MNPTPAINLETVENFFQILEMKGNVIVHGDVLLSASSELRNLTKRSNNQSRNLTDLISRLSDDFSYSQIIDFETCLKIGFYLFLHPDLPRALDDFLQKRPLPDTFTLSGISPILYMLEKDFGTFKKFGVNFNSRLNDFLATTQKSKARKYLDVESLSDEYVEKVTNEYLSSTKDSYSEYAYIKTHPQVFSLSVDARMAAMAFLPFLKSDDRFVNFFMSQRQSFHEMRLEAGYYENINLAKQMSSVPK